jgi:hypothetical protein
MAFVDTGINWATNLVNHVLTPETITKLENSMIAVIDWAHSVCTALPGSAWLLIIAITTLTAAVMLGRLLWSIICPGIALRARLWRIVKAALGASAASAGWLTVLVVLPEGVPHLQANLALIAGFTIGLIYAAAHVFRAHAADRRLKKMGLIEEVMQTAFDPDHDRDPRMVLKRIQGILERRTV